MIEKMASLTPGQEKCYHQLMALATTFPLLVIEGPKGSGKSKLANFFLQQWSGFQVVQLDLCHISLQGEGSLQAYNFYHHLNSLLNQTNDRPLWIYIRHWEKIKEILEDYGMDNRYFPRYALARFSEKLKVGEAQVLVTSDQDIRLDTDNYWVVKYNPDLQDVRWLLRPYFLSTQLDYLTPWLNKVKLGQVCQAIHYMLAFPECPREEKFKEALTALVGNQLDPDKKITKTTPEINLLGMEEIITEIETSIITPMNLSSSEVPLKKGLVLAGPPGTGKTSIGRWLAYRLRGKLYLVDGSAGVSGNLLLNAVIDTFDQAIRNTPAVVFIDDVDFFFEHEDTYRSFLTLLDGLENKDRGGLCVIVTCMNVTKIPSSLIRGGRLELVLETKLPNFSTRQKIIADGFDRMILLLERFEREGKIKAVVAKLTTALTSTFLRDITNKTEGWNCADIHRYLDDILRFLVVKGQQNEEIDLNRLSRQVYETIRRQYSLVKRPEEKPDFSMIYG